MSVATAIPDSAATSSVRWRPNWSLYAMEGCLLAMFMISACTFATLLEHPASPIHAILPSEFGRRALVGAAMGITAIGLIYSPLGRRSGAHMNPAMTMTFLRMRKIDPRDAAGYIAAQFIGGAVGVLIAAAVAPSYVAHPAVRYVATVPGSFGIGGAWVGEFAISFLLVTAVLSINRIRRLARFTGCFAGLLVAIYITFETPISGMSMNPARTLGSAFAGHIWTAWWIYLTAPVLGMLAAVEIQTRLSCSPHLLCGRLNHCRHTPTIFKCHCLAEHPS